MDAYMLKFVVAFTGIVWAGLLGSGFGVLYLNDVTAGTPAIAPTTLPAGSRSADGSALPTLVLFGDPLCACTRASLDELARLMSVCRGKVTARVIFEGHPAPGQDCTRSTLWQQAAAIPGVGVSLDADGAEARRFSAFTSGQVFLYDARGRLLFCGGITGGRGQEGDNPGRSAIVALLNGDTRAPGNTPVFGCALNGEVWR